MTDYERGWHDGVDALAREIRRIGMNYPGDTLAGNPNADPQASPETDTAATHRNKLAGSAPESAAPQVPEAARPGGVAAPSAAVALLPEAARPGGVAAPSIICHAPGDRCLGCAHYHGKATVCEYAAPELPPEQVAATASQSVADGTVRVPVGLAVELRAHVAMQFQGIDKPAPTSALVRFDELLAAAKGLT